MFSTNYPHIVNNLYFLPIFLCIFASYHFVMYKEHPQIYDMTTVFKGKTVPLISKGHDYDLTSNIFEKLKDIVFFEKKPNDGHNYVQIFGRLDNARALFYIDQ